MKRVTLNKNSWHFKYYTAVMSDKAPSSLCPYFWQMVILLTLSPIIIPAMGIGAGVSRLNKFIEKTFPKKVKKELTMEQRVEKMDKELEKLRIKNERMNKAADATSKVSKWILLPIFILGVIYAVYSTVSKIGFLALFIHICIALGIIAIIALIVYVGVEYGEKISKPVGKFFSFINPLNWKVTQIIGEMIVAWYKDACPLITWEGNQKEVTNEK
jgi:hypothetical protein